MAANGLSEVNLYVWLTIANDTFTEQIVGRLVRRNWKVVALGNTLSLRSEDNLATLLAFSISKTPKDTKLDSEVTQAKALDEIKDILKRLDARYYSLVVTQATGCTWCLGNLTKSLVESDATQQKRGLN